MPQSEKSLPDEESKTQRKNDMLALQKLGEALVKLSDVQLAKIAMPDQLRAAVKFAHTLKAHEAIRRHMQLIGKLMRKVDTEAIIVAINQVRFTNEQQTAEFHQVEKWRDELIAKGDEGIQPFLNEYPEADRVKLRQLIRKASNDRLHQKNTGGEKALFRYLRTLIEIS